MVYRTIKRIVYFLSDSQMSLGVEELLTVELRDDTINLGRVYLGGVRRALEQN